MKASERLRAVMNFEPVDRLPVFEWAPWWREETLKRWYGEGLPASAAEDWQISEFFGLDLHQQFWLRPRTDNCPAPAGHGMPIVKDSAGYDKLIADGALFGANCFDEEKLKHWAARRQAGDAFVWMTIEGFFWFPRTLLGIEPHMYAFYDQPELMHRMNSDLLAHSISQLEKFCEICKPDFVTLAEDMSYNHGPMLSADSFNEFLAPYYQKLTQWLKSADIPMLVDSDGDVTTLVNWICDNGASGLLPLERMAGVDVNQLRKDHPKLIMMGGFDKTVMHLGEKAIIDEFERISPAAKSLGYLPSCDHQTPPAVSIEDYRLYVSLFKQFATDWVK